MTPYYEHAGITIYHGDCREVLPQLSQMFDVIITDPPYAPNGNTQESNSRAGISIGLATAARMLKPDGTAFVFSTSSSRGLDWARECMKPLEMKRLMPWVREHTNSRVGGPWRWDTVLVGIYGRAVWGGSKYAGFYRSTSGAATPETTEHPVALPAPLGRWLLLPFEPGKILLDPFLGSGSLLVHARELGHKAIGIEIEERYCEIAAKRLAQEVLAL